MRSTTARSFAVDAGGELARRCRYVPSMEDVLLRLRTALDADRTRTPSAP